MTALVIAPKTPSDAQIRPRPPLDAPRFVDRAGDRAEHAERGPDQGEAAGDADLDARLAQRIELLADEIELRREIAEDEREDGEAVLVVGGDRSEQGDDEEEEREEREQRVVGNRRGVRQVLAIDQLDQCAPRRETPEPKLRAQAAEDAVPRHSAIIAGSGVVWSRPGALQRRPGYGRL